MILSTFKPKEIKSYLSENPINWYSEYARDTQMGGRGDRMAPIPIVDIFLRCLFEKGELFSQREFIIRCVEENKDWFDALPEESRKPWQAKIGRNFYPSCIDSLHVWALLHSQMRWDGKPVFDKCTIDTVADVKKKTDLVLHRGDEWIRVGLRIGSRAGRESSDYKRTYRIEQYYQDDGTISLPLDMSRAKAEGNKRWYVYPNDFKPLFRKVKQLRLPGFEGLDGADRRGPIDE